MKPPMLVLAVLRSPADKRAPRKKAARRVRKLRRCRIGWRRSKMKDDAVNGPRDREWDEGRPRGQSSFYPAKGRGGARHLEPSALPLHPWSKQHGSCTRT